MKGTRLTAVMAGLFIDVAGSALAGVVGGLVIGHLWRHSVDRSYEHWVALRFNFYLEFFGFCGTTFSTALGGYVAALLAPANPIANSLAVGVLSLFLGMALTILFPGVVPLWKAIAGASLTIPAALAGGYLALRASAKIAGRNSV